MAKSSIVLTLSSTVQTHSWAFAQLALKPLYHGDPRLHPERVGLDDTDLRKKLPCARIEDVKPLWAPEAEEGDRHPERPVSDFYWKRMKAPRIEGMLGQSWRNSKGRLLPAGVDLRATYTKNLDYMSLFELWCKLYKPSQGYLHYFGKEELPQSRFVTGETEAERVQERALSSFALGGFGADYDQKTFNLGFANYFPASLMTPAVCAELSEQGFDVAPLGEGVMLKLSESLEAVKQDFGQFSRRRAKAKDIIGVQHFVVVGEPSDLSPKFCPPHGEP